jgi:hypothetical protein
VRKAGFRVLNRVWLFATVIFGIRNSAKDEKKASRIVTVLPVTHSAPANPSLALELPPLVKKRLGLDDQPSWIVLTEANQFAWPGPDLRRTSDSGSIAYGLLPEVLYEKMRARFLDILRNRKIRLVNRTE